MFSLADGLLLFAAGFLVAGYLDHKVLVRWFKKYWLARAAEQAARERLARGAS